MARSVKRLMMFADAKNEIDWDELWNALNKVIQLHGSKLSSFNIFSLRVKEGADIDPANPLHNEETNLKVRKVLRESGLNIEQVNNAIEHLELAGIAFLEI